MALPPKEMHTSCLRCAKPLGPTDDICPACGADRRVELAIAGELNPAIASLQRWLVALAALQLLIAGLTYEHFSDKAADDELWSLVLPPLISAVVLLVLSSLARLAPLVVPMIALILYVAGFTYLLFTEPRIALNVDLPLALRVMFAMVLIWAVQAGGRARRIRLQAGRPRGVYTDRS